SLCTPQPTRFPYTTLFRSLVESLSRKIASIDESGFLDASILGEIVHPQNFNTLRRPELDAPPSQILIGMEATSPDARESLSRVGAARLHAPSVASAANASVSRAAGM